MEIIEIEVSKNQNGIVVTSSDTRKIEIANEDKELKATDVINFLDYKKDKEYKMISIKEDLKNDKNIQCVHLIFSEIIEKINNSSEV